MAIGRYDNRSFAQYKPLTMEEVLLPGQMQRQREDQIAEQFAVSQSELGKVGMLLQNEPEDSILRQNYNNYNNQMNSVWDSISENGVTPNTLRQAFSLKGQLSNVISPVMMSQEARAKDMALTAQVKSQDPTAVVEDVSQRSLDYYVNNGFTPTGVRSVSGNKITQEVSNLVGTLARIQNQPEISPADMSALHSFGMPEELVQNLMMTVKSTAGLSFDDLESNPVIQQAIGHVMRSNGVLDSNNNLADWIGSDSYNQLYQSALMGTYSAVGPTSYNISQNPFASQYLSERTAAAKAAASAKEKEEKPDTTILPYNVVDNYKIGVKKRNVSEGDIMSDTDIARGSELSTQVQDVFTKMRDTGVSYANEFRPIMEQIKEFADNNGLKSLSGKVGKVLGDYTTRSLVSDSLTDITPKATEDIMKEFNQVLATTNTTDVIRKIDGISSELSKSEIPIDRTEYLNIENNYATQVDKGYSYDLTPITDSKAREALVTFTYAEVQELDDNFTPIGKKKLNLFELDKENRVQINSSPNHGIVLRITDKNGKHKYYGYDDNINPQVVHSVQKQQHILNPGITNQNGIVTGKTADLLNEYFIATKTDMGKLLYDTNKGNNRQLAGDVLANLVNVRGFAPYIVQDPQDILEDGLQVIEASFPISQGDDKGYAVFRGIMDPTDGSILNAGMFSTFDKTESSFIPMVRMSQEFNRSQATRITKDYNTNVSDN